MLSLLFLLLLSSSIANAEPTPPLPGTPIYDFIDISAEEAHVMLEENPEQFILLDVRTASEYGAGHIPGAINIPVSDLENRIDELDMSKEIIVYCKSGGRSRTASETLAQYGFFVYNMLGGINAWKKENFATSTATPMPAQTPLPTLSPTVTPSATPAASPSPITSPITTPTPEEEKRIPGFEAPLAIMMLLILFMLLRRISR